MKDFFTEKNVTVSIKKIFAYGSQVLSLLSLLQIPRCTGQKILNYFTCFNNSSNLNTEYNIYENGQYRFTNI